MEKQYHTIILGGGNAGFGVSSILSEAGKSLAFVEEAEFGGTCPNRGCTPKKVLVEAASCLDYIGKAKQHGIKVGEANLDWSALIARKNAMIDFIPGAMLGLAEKRGDVYRGRGEFVGPDQIKVNDCLLSAENIVIATGSKTRPLPIEGAEHMITSNEVLSNTDLPSSVIFIGGGVIALEFSHVYARAGVEVTILEAMPQLLPRLDTEAVSILHEETQKLGVTIHTGVAINRIFKEGGSLQVAFEKEGNAQQISAHTVVNGTGRVANVDGLQLEKAGVTVERGVISVDKHFRCTQNPKIWVTGDALVAAPQLSPIATEEGKVVGNNILGEGMKEYDYRVVPSTVFTLPNLSSVGLSEQQAEAAGVDFKVSSVDMTDWFSARSNAESRAWAKVLIDNNSDLFIGVHIVGHKGEELINLFATAMRYGITASQLKADQFAYPTFSADIKNWY